MVGALALAPPGSENGRGQEQAKAGHRHSKTQTQTEEKGVSPPLSTAATALGLRRKQICSAAVAGCPRHTDEEKKQIAKR